MFLCYMNIKEKLQCRDLQLVHMGVENVPDPGDIPPSEWIVVGLCELVGRPVFKIQMC